MEPDRRLVLTGMGVTLIACPVRADDGMMLDGSFVQGGHAMGRTWPRARIFVDGEALTTASAQGRFVVGFDRHAPPSTRIEVRAGGRRISRVLTIAPGTFPTTRIDGLPPSTVEPTNPALLARIRQEAAIKAEAFASQVDDDAFADGMIWPLQTYRISSEWGSQRVLNGTPARPHYGIDLAAPAGTPIRAPAAGRVVLARTGLHFEGGLTLIDHGQGLITAYLHQSDIVAREATPVRRGDVIGYVGTTGRATGPHLCWRMKWRNRNLDPSRMIAVVSP